MPFARLFERNAPAYGEVIPVNSEFLEVLSVLCAENVEFLLIGGFAMIAHGLPRNPRDIDVWVRPSPDNAQRVWNALS